MKEPRNPRHSGRVIGDFMGAVVNITTIVGTFVEIGRITMAAGQGLALGWGFRRGQHDAEGRIFAQLQTAVPGAVHGVLRFVSYTPDNRPHKVLAEFRTERLLAVTAANPTTHVPLPVINHVVGFAWSLRVEINATAALVMTQANSTLNVDCTAFEVPL